MSGSLSSYLMVYRTSYLLQGEFKIAAIGIILDVNTDGRQRKFDVEWSSGTSETVAARSISLSSVQEPQSQSETAPNAPTTTFSDLLLGFNEGASVDIESSSSSDEDKLYCEERAEHEEDGLINANGRTWTPCEAVLVGPGAHMPMDSMSADVKSLKDWFATRPQRGAFKVLSSTTDMNTTMYAAGWVDRKPKTIIANRGTTLPGTDADTD
ncbi:unnamed protein product [Phytophthora fragariaefolia]|uniref:Unnamed protein product n=1 Tax=Phytophthora fragariaefolia TaxID=1490495 RepID=A0A9W7DFI3_9STRA|nr:unnamed protein product [Phytophthora fragariaefolia]